MATEYNAANGTIKKPASIDDGEVKTTLEDKFKARETESTGQINSFYDSNLNAQKQSLLDAYNQNVAEQNAYTSQAKQNYSQALADVATQNAKEYRDTTRFADARDVNTGSGSQHQLRLGNSTAKANAQLNYSQAQALEESARQAALLETSYKNRVANALADNDYKRAAALMDDYNNRNTWMENQAGILASYGNFEGYGQLYGKDAAETMQGVWNAQNPDTAYAMGRITAEQYKNLTGSYPAGYSSGGGYGWGDGWYDPSGGGPPKSTTLNQMQVLSNFSNGVSNAGSNVLSLAASGQSGPSGYDRYHT